MSKDEPLGITLTRQNWEILLHLALQGGRAAWELFALGKAHTVDCMTANADAVKALHSILYPDTTDTPDTAEPPQEVVQ